MSEESNRAREILEQLGLSQREAARKLDLNVREFRRMCADGRPFPRVVILALEELARKGEAP